MKKLFVFLAAATLCLSACSKGTSVPGTQATAQPPAPMANATNPTNFPLIEGATVIAAKPFSQTINSSQMGTGVFSNGSGTYNGTEVIAGSNATFADLENWLRQNEKQPPSGYTAVVIPASMGAIHSVAVKNGIDFAMFHDASKHGVVVIAMDPATTNAKLGRVLAMISKYQALPQGLRNGIDSQLKQRFGYTAGEFVEPGSPLGTAVGALGDFKNNNERGVLIIDAGKQ